MYGPLLVSFSCTKKLIVMHKNLSIQPPINLVFVRILSSFFLCRRKPNYNKKQLFEIQIEPTNLTSLIDTHSSV